jgi:hypothetical protein
VCEQEGARRLPFRTFAAARANRSRGTTVVLVKSYLVRAVEPKSPRTELSDELVGGVLRALGMKAREVNAMLAGKRSAGVDNFAVFPV